MRRQLASERCPMELIPMWLFAAVWCESFGTCGAGSTCASSSLFAYNIPFKPITEKPHGRLPQLNVPSEVRLHGSRFLSHSNLVPIFARQKSYDKDFFFRLVNECPVQNMPTTFSLSPFYATFHWSTASHGTPASQLTKLSEGLRMKSTMRRRSFLVCCNEGPRSTPASLHILSRTIPLPEGFAVID